MDDLRATLVSQNPHKLAELRAVLADWELAPFAGGESPPEVGSTYYENARAKARFGWKHGGGYGWVLGEDSGIEASALGGRPGIASARWAEDGVARLLAELEDVQDRRARYVCELVALPPTGEEQRGTGTLEGRIGEEPHGDEGFGYDPVFVPEGETRTVAELGNEWKAEHSHRARAALALLEALG